MSEGNPIHPGIDPMQATCTVWIYKWWRMNQGSFNIQKKEFVNWNTAVQMPQMQRGYFTSFTACSPQRAIDHQGLTTQRFFSKSFERCRRDPYMTMLSAEKLILHISIFTIHGLS
ncbi:MAG: hypothetical protein ACP5VS_06950 [Desulfomonilaceae bacterium]